MVPCVGWVHNVVAPAHRLTMSHGVLQTSNTHSNSSVSVSSGTRPAHQWALPLAFTAEFDGPVVVGAVVGRVAMDMLSLGHEDPRNFVSMS